MTAEIFAFPSAPSPADLARWPMNDLGNAMRLILLAGGVIGDDGEVNNRNATLLYVLNLGWIGFNGVYWDRKFGEDLARKLAHRVAGVLPSLYKEFVETGATAKGVMDFIRSGGSAGATSAMLRQAQSYLIVEIDAFDRDPLVLNCLNGTLRLARGKQPRLDAQAPADRLTRCVAASWNPLANAALFESTVLQSLPDAAERAAFGRTMGYSSTGCIDEQAFFFCQGPGRDGKSTILDAIRETLGSYATPAKVETFLEGLNAGGSGPQPDLIALAGDTRLAIVSEPKRGAKLNEGLLKAWTSGSPISARDLNAKPIVFRPVPKLVWEMNAFPVAKGDDDGIWRRIKVHLYRRQVPERDVDRQLPEKLRGEMDGILVWLVGNIMAWLEHGLSPPDSLREVLEEYRRSSSPFGDWLTERCVYGGEARDEKGKPCETASSDLIADLKDWWKLQGYDEAKIPSMRSLGDFLRDRQILVKKGVGGTKRRFPIRLKTALELGPQAESYAAASSGATGLPSSASGPRGGDESAFSAPVYDDGPDEWDGR